VTHGLGAVIFGKPDSGYPNFCPSPLALSPAAKGFSIMSALPSKMSALPPKADILCAERDVRFVPIADIGQCKLKQTHAPQFPAGRRQKSMCALVRLYRLNAYFCDVGHSKAGRVGLRSL
jgi:hypothetical protein